VDQQGNVWIADFAGNKEGTKGHQIHKFSPKGEKLISLGMAGKPGNADGQFNQPNDVAVGPDGSIYVSDGHDAQGMTTNQAIDEGLKRGATSRISKFTADGKFVKSWGRIGVRHGEFRTPHALMFDARGRLWVADRGNHRLEIFDQEGKYLESRYMFGRISGFFIRGNLLYAIDSESGPLNHPNWRDGVRIGPLDEDRITAFIPPFERGTVVPGRLAKASPSTPTDVYAAEGPNSLTQAGARSPNTRSELRDHAATIPILCFEPTPIGSPQLDNRSASAAIIRAARDATPKVADGMKARCRVARPLGPIPGGDWALWRWTAVRRRVLRVVAIAGCGAGERRFGRLVAR
jgi:DNA-binding beta-propeller fold protein YncE